MNDLIRFRPRALALLALLVLAALLPGCGRNGASHLLVPTGIRPAPTDSSGVVFGYVRHDSTTYPGLEGAPYPPTIIELRHNGELVAQDTARGDKREFRFGHLPAGLYVLNASAHAFFPTAPVAVSLLAGVRDAGDLFLPARSDSLASLVFVVGTMPGFSIDDAFSYFASIMEARPLGVFTYPPFPAPGDTAVITPIAAGTYRFKFATDFGSTANALIGWGGDSTVTLTAPVTNSPVRYASGPAQDIKVTIPTTGKWAFTLDERRLTFSIAPLSAASAGPARARTPR